MMQKSFEHIQLQQKNTELRWRISHLFKMNWSRKLILIFSFAGILPPLVFRIIAWYHGEALSEGWDFFKTIMISVFTTLTISIGVVNVMIWLQKKYPWSQGIFKRLFLEVVFTTFTSFFLITTITIITHFTFLPKENLKESIFNYLIVAMIMNFILVAITEGIFFFREWKNSAVEAERFKKESIRAQFESLKHQVNPHFLFNSLNTLSSLIDHDKEMSKEFLDDLSTVYRYVLQNKDKELVLLDTEMDFINAYIQLLKKRHGDRVSFHFNVSKEALNKGIPPMTLQLLVENAVKHNVSSRKKPLTVEVFNQANTLVVRNNLQKKKKVNSTGIGLNNIKERYRYLVEEEIAINETDHIFEVSVPLINMI